MRVNIYNPETDQLLNVRWLDEFVETYCQGSDEYLDGLYDGLKEKLKTGEPVFLSGVYIIPSETIRS